MKNTLTPEEFAIMPRDCAGAIRLRFGKCEFPVVLTADNEEIYAALVALKDSGDGISLYIKDSVILDYAVNARWEVDQ